MSVIAPSSLLLPSTPKPSSTPNGRRPKPNPNNRRRSPLLSDDCRQESPAAANSAASRRLLGYYARLASKLARNGKLRDFLMIAESVLTSDAVSEIGPSFVARMDARMISVGIVSAIRGGNLGEVLDFVKGAEKIGVRPSSLFDERAKEALAAACRSLVDEGRLEEFVGLMETLAGHQFFIRDIVDPVDILKIFVAKRDPSMAVRYASVFPHSQLLFCSIIQEFGKKNDMTSAIRVFKALKQKSGGISMFSCRSIIDTCGLCGDFLKSRNIFEELLAQKVTLNTYFFNSLMNVNAHDLSYSLHVYEHMQNAGVPLDMTSYNILLKACCSAKRVDLAQDIYKEIKHMALNGALKLDVITYSSMIKAFADAKMWQMALNVKEDMLLANVNPNVVTWSSLIGACSNAGLVDRAAQLFDEMLLSGCEPNTQCCNILLSACIKSCQYDRAFRFFYSWKETGFQILHAEKGMGYGDTHDSLVVKHSLSEGSNHSTCTYGLETLRIMVPFRPTVATFNILMKACGTDHHRANALMDEMKIMGISPNHISWSILIDIYGSSQNIKGAMQVFTAMRHGGIKLDVVAYTTAIKACVGNKNLKMAFYLFKEMKKYRLQPNLVTYNTLLRARSRYGSLHEVQQCLAIYQEMRKAGYSANDYYLKELIEEWCEGVIGSSNQNQGPLTIVSYKKTDTKKPSYLFLEKIAKHLQKDVGENQAIDIRGLTKVEARIVVLSVLRMVKECYRLGEVVKDDMIIICGVGNESNNSGHHELEAQQMVLKVLRDELGLDVMVDHGFVCRNRSTSLYDEGEDAVAVPTENAELPTDYRYLVRRPRGFQVLKVPSKSLYNWLQKKCRQ